jgi:hypothetical protein
MIEGRPADDKLGVKGVEEEEDIEGVVDEITTESVLHLRRFVRYSSS